jgi:hypothetical protein
MSYGDRNRLQDYRAVFGSPEGKRVLADLAARHWMFGGTLHAESLVMAHREGERNVVLGIIDYMEMKPDDLPAIRESMITQFGIPQEA